MRLHEVLRLKWDDIDFGKGLIMLTQSKTGKSIVLLLSSCLADELIQYKTTFNSEYFSNLFKELGIHNFTFHNLRHTFSSLLQAELGIGAVVVQGMTGHSSLGMLQKYSHSGLDSKQRAIQALTNHILGMSNKDTMPMVSKTGTA